MLARGEVLDLARVRAETEARRREVGEALERFAHNTIEHMREERELLAGKIEMPRFATDFRDRSALVVVRGVDHQRDLRALRPFIRDTRPVLIAVDGGAEALLEEGLRPDMIVGDMDSAGEAALMAAAEAGAGWGSATRSGGAELVVHAYPDGRAPGRERLERLGLPFKLVPAPGTSQDVAMLIAAEKGADLIVSVGSQFNLVEFLDRNREGMSSTFLTRLRIGEILVDAKGVSRLYHPRPGLAPLLVVVVAGPARDDRRRLADPRAARRGRPALAQAPAAGRGRPVEPSTGSSGVAAAAAGGSSPKTPSHMFDYRYHALSLAAVLLALAVGVLIGVAIGDSNLVSSAKNGIVHNLESEVDGAQRQAGQLQTQLSAEESFANDLYPLAVHGLLTGHNIGLVFLGGSSDRVDSLVRDAVTQAGGNLATVVAVREPLDLAGLAQAAAGTHYAGLATDPELVHKFGGLAGRQLVSGGALVEPGASQPRAQPAAERLRRAARQARRTCRDALRTGRNDHRTDPGERRLRVGADRRRDRGRGPGRGGRAEQHRTLPGALVQEPGHLQRRRPRHARRSDRAGLCPRGLPRRLRDQVQRGLPAAERRRRLAPAVRVAAESVISCRRRPERVRSRR